MKALIVVVLLVIILGIGWVFWSESGTAYRAERALQAGSGLQALVLYERLYRRSHLIFLNREDVALGREQAALVALRQVVEEHDFRRAPALIDTIVAGPESGAEAEALSIAARLPEMHLDWINQLLNANQVDAALHECAAMRHLYVGQAGITARMQTLEWRAQILRAQNLLHDGDLHGVLAVALALDEEAALPLRAEADLLARQAISHTTDWYVDSQDYPGLYRWLAATMAQVQRRPALLRHVQEVQAAHDRQLFGTPATREAEDIAPVVAVGISSLPGQAVLTIDNDTAHPLLVRLRGPEVIEATVGIGEQAALVAPQGEYVQFAHDGESEIRPYLGILRVEEQVYRQVFAVSQLNGHASNGKPTAAAMLAHAVDE